MNLKLTGMDEKIIEMLRGSRIEVAPGTFYLVSMGHAEWRQLLTDPELSPRLDAPFMILSDAFEVTMMLDEADYSRVRPALGGAKTAGNYRLLTFDLVMGLDVVGFMAFVSRVLADAGVPIMALSAYSRDHLLISQADLPRALNALRPYVDELC